MTLATDQQIAEQAAAIAAQAQAIADGTLTGPALAQASLIRANAETLFEWLKARDRAAEAEADDRVTDTRRWYNREERAWVVEAVNAKGYQIGEAVYIGVGGGGRELAKFSERKIREAHGLKLK